MQASELIHLVHCLGDDDLLMQVALDVEMYKAPGPTFSHNLTYESLAEIASFGLWQRLNPKEGEGQTGPGVERALFQCLQVLSSQDILRVFYNLGRVFTKNSALKYPSDVSSWPPFISVTRQVADRIEKATKHRSEVYSKEAIAALRSWATQLERAMTRAAPKSHTAKASKTKPKRPRSISTTKKTSNPRRKA